MPGKDFSAPEGFKIGQQVFTASNGLNLLPSGPLHDDTEAATTYARGLRINNPAVDQIFIIPAMVPDF